MHVYLISLFLIFCGFWVTAPLGAADIDTRLPADFLRVTKWSDLDEKAYYALGAVNDKGKLVLVSTEIRRNDKLLGISLEDEPADRYRFKNSIVVWKMKMHGPSSCSLVTAADGKALCRRKSGSTGLKLLEGTDESSAWKISLSENGTFLFREPENEHSVLGLSAIYTSTETVYVFDNYRMPDAEAFYLYKLPFGIDDEVGEVVMPSEGQRVALCNGGMVRGVSGKPLSTDDALLLDGTLAPFPDVEIWTCEVENGKIFRLKSESGYLDGTLQSDSRPFNWQVVKGHICTAEERPRYLCFDSQQRVWRVLEKNQATNPARFFTVADHPQRDLTSDGVCHLRGGWTATALSGLEWANVRCLDLTDIVLPVNVKAFNEEPTTANLPIFVAEQNVSAVPESWHFVVACGEANRLFRNTLMEDEQPFYTDRPFEVESGQLRYERMPSAPDVWETLCLPFRAIPDSGVLAVFEGCQSGNLSFVPAASVPAGKACLFSATSASPVSFESVAGTVFPEPDGASVFRGTYEGFEVTTASPTCYFLTEKGETFVRTAPTSTLRPFRCFVLAP